MLWFLGVVIIVIDVFHRVSVPYDPPNASPKIYVNTTSPAKALSPNSTSQTLPKNAIIIDDKAMSLLLDRLQAERISSERNGVFQAKQRAPPAPSSNLNIKEEELEALSSSQTEKIIFEEKPSDSHKDARSSPEKVHNKRGVKYDPGISSADNTYHGREQAPAMEAV